MPTFTDEQLIAFAAGELAPPETAAVAAFVQSDRRAADLVNAWRVVRGLVASDDGAEPSMAAITRAKAIFVGRAVRNSVASTVSGWIGAVDRFVARLVYDSRVQPAAVRFADNDDRITLTFATDDGEIDVQASRAEGEIAMWRLMGQIADAQPGLRDVALVRHGESVAATSATSDAHGEFAFDIPPGEYDLLVRAGDGAIVLSPIALHA